MKLLCPQCHCFLGNLTSDYSGHPAHCESCGADFIIPFSDSGRLLEWAATTSWEHLEEGNRNSIGRGHPLSVLNRYQRIYRQRLEEEMVRLERESQGSS